MFSKIISTTLVSILVNCFYSGSTTFINLFYALYQLLVFYFREQNLRTQLDAKAAELTRLRNDFEDQLRK